MVLGEMVFNKNMYGNETETMCKPFDGVDLSEQLAAAVANIQGQITEFSREIDETEEIDTSIPADPTVKNFSYTLVDGEVYYRENSRMVKPDLSDSALERAKGMIGLSACVSNLIEYQLENYSDSVIKQTQEKLHTLYDNFSAKYGLINDKANEKAFSEDSAYYLLCSLEVINENGDFERKADMFDKRTIKQNEVVTSVNTASEALAVSISEKAGVDLPYMGELTGFSEERIINDLQGVIFRNPAKTDHDGNPRFETADEYLSGNIRDKLRFAEVAAQGKLELFSANVAALKKAMPKDLEASEIDVRLGSTWIHPKYVKQFMFELLDTSSYGRNNINVKFFPLTAEWNVEGKNADSHNNPLSTVTYGTSRMNAYKIIEDTLNLKDVRIYDNVTEPDGKERRVLNHKQTTLAAQKQDAIRQKFRDWIFADPERRENLTTLYNERFNSIRPREYDGSHIVFSGMNPEMKLENHQKNAVAHALYGGNALFAHEVGAGKTFEMIATAMESKRLGLCTKSMFVVPNHLTEQTASEFYRLYPAANILVATKKDFETQNRKKFCGKIATGSYDAVIIGHSQFEKIPMSFERQERLIREQIREIIDGIQAVKNARGENFTIKQLEKTKRNLETKLAKLHKSERKDSVVNFEELGIDKLIVDEAHSYKNLFLTTKMRNVAGISQTDAQKSSDMYMKCRYLDEITGGKGIVFATGTPISNSMTEFFTMQRYLQHDTLKKQGLSTFDAWASTFGETVTAIELAPEGTGYRAKTRFSKFFNLPELMNMFKEVADIKTADMLNLPVPLTHFVNIAVKPSEQQQELVKDLSKRATKIQQGKVDPSVDNMLCVTNDGRKIGLDQRLINPLLPDNPNSKVNTCMRNVYDIWEKNADKKLTQLIFCDFSTPKKDGTFNVYDDIREKLVKKGVPRNEIAFIHEADTEAKKKELFAKVRSGQVRVLMGSTFKMGTGTNVQDKIIALHDLDAPWRPADLEQRRGRGARRGNQNPEIKIFRYVTEGTFDSYLYQTLENKQKFISQIMTSKSPVRSCEDADESVLTYAEVKALCAGNPLIKEKMNLDIEVSKLKLLKSEHKNTHYRLETAVLKRYPAAIQECTVRIAALEKDLKRLAEHPNAPDTPEVIPPMVINGVTFTDKKAAGEAFAEVIKNAYEHAETAMTLNENDIPVEVVKKSEPVAIGTYRGFDMYLAVKISSMTNIENITLTLKGDISHSIALDSTTFRNVPRIDKYLSDISIDLSETQEQLVTLNKQLENAKTELTVPFALEQELADKSARLVELDAALNIGGKNSEKEAEAADIDEAIAAKSVSPIAAVKPSIVNRVKEIQEQLRTASAPTTPDKSRNTNIDI